LRRGGKATTGELVIGTSGDRLYIGRWFQKQGKRAIVSDGLAEVASHHVKVLAAITLVIRQR
ncbi:MAG TPA: hypothetical protein VEZ11_15010, partial [Thermoanaerobaculia bacterium]|nr:hypothetical protein [Thermoanaerobaculia bacterium]